MGKQRLLDSEEVTSVGVLVKAELPELEAFHVFPEACSEGGKECKVTCLGSVPLSRGASCCLLLPPVLRSLHTHICVYMPRTRCLHP
jgi:hypothetical protein